jgi:hypothetical protein
MEMWRSASAIIRGKGASSKCGTGFGIFKLGRKSDVFPYSSLPSGVSTSHAVLLGNGSKAMLSHDWMLRILRMGASGSQIWPNSFEIRGFDGTLRTLNAWRTRILADLMGHDWLLARLRSMIRFGHGPFCFPHAASAPSWMWHRNVDNNPLIPLPAVACDDRAFSSNIIGSRGFWILLFSRLQDEAQRLWPADIIHGARMMHPPIQWHEPECTVISKASRQ